MGQMAIEHMARMKDQRAGLTGDKAISMGFIPVVVA
mgnify:CR=1 FL=1